jgi:hypothetical protein
MCLSRPRADLAKALKLSMQPFREALVRRTEHLNQEIALPYHFVSVIAGLIGLGIVMTSNSQAGVLGDLFAVDVGFDPPDRNTVFLNFCAHEFSGRELRINE